MLETLQSNRSLPKFGCSSLQNVISNHSEETIYPLEEKPTEPKSILQKSKNKTKKRVQICTFEDDENENKSDFQRAASRQLRMFNENDLDIFNPYEELTAQQIEAFRQVFELLDKDGGGSIDADELYNSMKDLDVNLSRSEIFEILKELDRDGNGEIDFEEFLYMMTSMSIQLKEAQMGELKVENPRLWKRQSIFFSVITKFAMKHSLNEIERYYANKARNVPHVIGHYAAGVRVDGLSEKQLQRTWRNLTAAMKDEKSPYAKPLNFVIPVRGSNKCKKKTIRPQSQIVSKLSSHAIVSSKGKPDRKTSFIQKQGSTKESQDTIPRQLKSRKREQRDLKSLRASKKKGWTPIHTLPTQSIQLPVVKYSSKAQNKNLTIEDLPKIRQKVLDARNTYYVRLNDAKKKLARECWTSLHIEEIPSERLQNNFRKVFRTYSPQSNFIESTEPRYLLPRPSTV